MASKDDLTSLHQRLSEFTQRFEKSARESIAQTTTSGSGRTLKSAFQNLKDLFSQGITHDGLKDLFERDTREVFRFYTKEIDFETLRPLPPFKRYPLTAWKIFVATAHRLSPPRRIAFVVATFAFLLGALNLLSSGREPGAAFSAVFWWFVALAIFVLLLLMELRDKLDLKGDLEIAREIQFGLIPSRPFQQDGISIDSLMRPANTVGGDYCDIIVLGEHQVAVVIGDVSGKGMPAALLMALLQGSLRTLITAGFRGGSLIKKLNEYLYANIPSNRLVTLFYGELDTMSGRLCYVNAGHNAPFLMRREKPPERLPATSTALGIFVNLEFGTAETCLEKGETLLLFTDGLTEAFNLQDEEFGEARFAELLQRHVALPADELIQKLASEVLIFCGPNRPVDDMTLLFIRNAGMANS